MRGIGALAGSVPLEDLQLSSMLVIAASSCTLVLGAATVLLYRRHYRTLQCVFNDLAVLTCATQMVQCAFKVVFAVVTLVRDAPLDAALCDASATIDQFLEPASILLMACSFFVLASARRYTRHDPESVALWALLSFVVAAITVAGAWVVLRDARTANGGHFTQQLGWCWIPIRAGDIEGEALTAGELIALHTLCAYLYSLLLLATAGFVLVRLGCCQGGIANRHVNRPLFFTRFFGVMLFPIATYGLGAYARLSGAHMTTTPRDAFVAMSFMFPFSGAINCAVFMYTERLVAVLLCCKSEPDPNGFAAIVNALSCAQMVGMPVNDTESDADHFLSRDDRDRQSPTANGSPMHSADDYVGTVIIRSSHEPDVIVRVGSQHASKREGRSSSALPTSQGSRRSQENADDTTGHLPSVYHQFHDHFTRALPRHNSTSRARRGTSPAVAATASMIDDARSSCSETPQDFEWRSLRPE